MKVKKLVLQTYYRLGDEYIPFKENPLSGKNL